MPQLAERIRAKHPGVYDDLDDATLEARLVEKFPEYRDLATPRDYGSGVEQFGRGMLRSLEGTVEGVKNIGRAAAAVPTVVGRLARIGSDEAKATRRGFAEGAGESIRAIREHPESLAGFDPTLTKAEQAGKTVGDIVTFLALKEVPGPRAIVKGVKARRAAQVLSEFEPRVPPSRQLPPAVRPNIAKAEVQEAADRAAGLTAEARRQPPRQQQRRASDVREADEILPASPDDLFAQVAARRPASQSLHGTVKGVVARAEQQTATPPKFRVAAPEAAEVQAARQALREKAGGPIPKGMEGQIERLRVEYRRTQNEAKRLKADPTADARESQRLHQAARELGSRLSGMEREAIRLAKAGLKGVGPELAAVARPEPLAVNHVLTVMAPPATTLTSPT